ncbi:GNAT family N-acetyltransferase [Paenibacillus sp. GP183]|uniref:GNAT family N-acetyltransferase n=1 Tax=Paenibacillus sp. GP183 TaxID=1882751 RepID=UPI000894E98E|nr:GNAT family N-acetyltransferase [Paenibacillus sp. GP183]SEC23433.1 Ribosomal protein S18 acetylase RimI [Paenibacillus sp. GP183]
MKDGIKPCYGLTEKELSEIKRLSLLCNQSDAIRLKLNWDMLRERSVELNNDFLYYKNNVLIGFLGIYSFNSKEAEISGMVHPDYRRRGIFQELTDAAVKACRRRSIPKLIFICPRTSASGKAFLDALGAAYSFSEYRMEMMAPLESQAQTASDTTASQANLSHEGIRIREAGQPDTELLVRLNMSGFSMSEQDVREYVAVSLNGKGDKTYIAELGEVPIGKIGAQLIEAAGFIYGFTVLAEYRGKGYGRQILAQTIQSMRSMEPDVQIALEVAVENERALGLYESCGFYVVTAYDYHELYL